ncbi:MAG: glycosyltransferase, partial [Ktedonobacteraceae bacterium]|nr:glycosyltransferase [Ktedonobacteraceae bacterium]
YELASLEILTPTQKLAAGAREKYIRGWLQNENQTLLQSISPLALDLSVVIPTRNEQDNIRPLLEALSDALQGLSVEIIFVDDSDDTTPEIIKDVARTMDTMQFHIRLEHRLAGNERSGGLATAVVFGMSRAQARYVAVIDADLQHPPAQLRVFYDLAVAENVDFVLASRYIKGGSYQGLADVRRRFISVGLKWTAKLLFPERLRDISDPLGGFFLLRRSILMDVSLRPIGYKILLELLLRCQWNAILEVPYHFQTRTHGQSKANMRQGTMALHHMARLLLEVPHVGRAWKMSATLLLNILVTIALLLIHTFFVTISTNVNVVTFAVMAVLDFVIFNRFIFPSPTVGSSIAPSLPSKEKQLVKIASTPPIEDNEELDGDDEEPENEKTVEDEKDEQIEVWLVKDVEEEAEGLLVVDKETAQEDSEELRSEEEENENVEEDAEGSSGEDEGIVKVLQISDLEAPSMQLVEVSASEIERRLQPERPKRSFVRFRSISKQKRSRRKQQSVVAVVIVLLALGWIVYVLPGLLAVVAALCLGAAIAFTKNVKRDHIVTMLLAIAVGVASIDYLSWRFMVANWPAWWISVPLLFAETLGAIHAFGFQFTVWPWPTSKIAQGDDPTRHPIFIFVPTVNEGIAILRPTLEGIIAARDKYLARYPHGKVTIVLCNDGRVAQEDNWQDVEFLAEELEITCVTRTVGGGAKAGNIENARQRLNATNDAFIVIFDADQVAKPDFLLKTIPPFRDQHMGWVQTGQYYSNLDNPVSRWADDQQSMFYNLLCPGKAALNAAFICGTNVVIRAAALDEIGGLPQDSVTEDFAASIALHPSWRSVYLTDILATGMGPLDVPSYLKQQRRWAIGTLGVFRTHWRDILLPKKHGLNAGQRIQYFLACTHYLCGLRDLIYLISPILFIFTGVPAVRGSTLGEFLLHFVPYCVLSFTALWYSSRGITGLRGIIIGFGCFPVLIESLFSVVLQRKVGFSVTSKQSGGKRSTAYLRIYYFLFLLCIVCLVWATHAKGQEQTSLFISLLWVVYSMLMLGSFLWLNIKDIRFHQAAQRSRVTRQGIAGQSYPTKLLSRKRGLHPVWNLGLAALVACPMLINGSLSFLSPDSKPFLIAQDYRPAPYFGVSLPVQLLTSQPPILAHDLGTQFSIMGRTQDIHDEFDMSWANQLAEQHARPWITLQFGVFGPHNKPPLDANLPAIYNGDHDQQIQKWASTIRAYGKPVYLTILQHADRNWSLSSGVANGGIPQDVAKAWLHVQSIFHKAGADNVAWVWAPADPLNDQIYAPPLSSIDAVLQSFIDYPGTKWGDPETVLMDLTDRYPTKPIIVEASVNGSAAQKSAWLTKLGQAVNYIPQVHALLYHEGGPGLNATRAQIKSWSMTSDPASLAVMRNIVSGLQQKVQAAK